MSAAATTSTTSYQFEKLNLNASKRSRSSYHTSCSVSWNPRDKHGYCSSTRKQLYSSGINRRGRGNRIIMNIDLSAVNNIPPMPSASGSPFPGWSNWMLLTIIPMVIPLFTGKWGTLLAFKKKVDATLDTIEEITETIEDVAESVDKIADEVSEKLPQGSKLRNYIERLDNIAEQTVIAADYAQDVLQKVEDVQDEVEKIMKEPTKNKVKDENLLNEPAKDEVEEATKKEGGEK